MLNIFEVLFILFFLFSLQEHFPDLPNSAEVPKNLEYGLRFYLMPVAFDYFYKSLFVLTLVIILNVVLVGRIVCGDCTFLWNVATE